MLNWTRIFGLATILCVAMSASAQTADPPLFTFFKTFCAETKGNQAAIKKAVEAAGGEVTILPDTDSSPMKLRWERGSGADKISLSSGTIRFRGKRIERTIPSCDVFDYSNDVAGADAIRDWVGVPPSKFGPGETYEYTYQEIGGLKFAVPSGRFFDTDDVWRIEVRYEIGGAISVEMAHNTVQTLPTSN